MRHVARDIAGGAVEPTLTDWRGDPPVGNSVADWAGPPIRIPDDLPDRFAGVAYPPGTTARRLTQVGARVSTEGASLDRHATELATRSAAAR